MKLCKIFSDLWKAPWLGDFLNFLPSWQKEVLLRCVLWNTVLQGINYNKNITDLQSNERHSRQRSLSVLLKTKLQILPLVWEIAKSENAWRLQRENYNAVLSLFLILFWKFSAAVAWARTCYLPLWGCCALVRVSVTGKELGKTRAEQPLLQAVCLYSRCSTWFVPTTVTL